MSYGTSNLICLPKVFYPWNVHFHGYDGNCFVCAQIQVE